MSFVTIIIIIILVNVVLFSLRSTAEAKVLNKTMVRFTRGVLIPIAIYILMILGVFIYLFIRDGLKASDVFLSLLFLIPAILVLLLFINVAILYDEKGFAYRNFFREKKEYLYDDIKWYQIHQDKVILKIKDREKEIKFEFSVGGENFAQYIKKYKTP